MSISMAPTRARALARAGTYLTSKGCFPKDDPRRPAVHGLSLGGNSLVVATRVMKVLRDAGYTDREVRTYFHLATLGAGTASCRSHTSGALSRGAPTPSPPTMRVKTSKSSSAACAGTKRGLPTGS